MRSSISVLIPILFFRHHYSQGAEKAMAPHSSTLGWKIPWTGEPGGLQSMGSPRVGHDWANSLSLFTFMHWRRKWQPTPVFLPGESQGRGSLVGCGLWGRTDSDTTEVTSQQQQQLFTNDLCMYLSLFWTNLFCNNFCCRCHRFMWRKISHRVL